MASKEVVQNELIGQKLGAYRKEIDEYLKRNNYKNLKESTGDNDGKMYAFYREFSKYIHEYNDLKDDLKREQMERTVCY